MTDYVDMRKYLEGLTERQFYTLIYEFCGVDTSGDGRLEFSVATGGTRQVNPNTRREEWTEQLLSYKEENKSEWHRLCYYARIDDDAARQIQNTRRANIIAIIALVAAVVSLLVTIYPNTSRNPIEVRY